MGDDDFEPEHESAPQEDELWERNSVVSGISEAEVQDEVECEDSAVEPEVQVDAVQFMAARIRFAFTQLDEVDVPAMFARRGVVMQNVPRFLRGAFRNAVRVALDEIKAGSSVNDARRQERGWKLFMLIPRMLLHRRPRGGTIPREKLVQRFEQFSAGQWLELIRICVVNEEESVKVARCRSRRQGQDAAVRRAERADQLVHLGELSSARRVLESAELAPGTPETLRQLRARPSQPRDPLPDDILGHVPDVEFQLDADRFKRNVRSAKRGAAGGPSGMTMEHLRTLLDSPRDTQSLYVVCELLARGAVPNSIRDIVRIGRLTALQKPSGGVRGIVAGDVIRRVVARTMPPKAGDAPHEGLLKVERREFRCSGVWVLGSFRVLGFQGLGSGTDQTREGKRRTRRTRRKEDEEWERTDKTRNIGQSGIGQSGTGQSRPWPVEHGHLNIWFVGA